jgi:hypothetical protein
VRLSTANSAPRVINAVNKCVGSVCVGCAHADPVLAQGHIAAHCTGQRMTPTQAEAFSGAGGEVIPYQVRARVTMRDSRSRVQFVSLAIMRLLLENEFQNCTGDEM